MNVFLGSGGERYVLSVAVCSRWEVESDQDRLGLPPRIAKFSLARDTAKENSGIIMSIPDFQTLMLPVLRIAAEGEVRISDVVERLAAEFPMSAEERSQLLPSGKQTTFANRVNWAKSYLGKAGLVELTKRAHFRITEQGREVLAAPPERIDIKYLNRFPGFQQFRERGDESDGYEAAALGVANIVTSLAPDEVMRNAHRQLEIALADELMQRIRSGTPAFFESLVVRLLASGHGLRRLGYRCQQGADRRQRRRRRRWCHRPRSPWP